MACAARPAGHAFTSLPARLSDPTIPHTPPIPMARFDHCLDKLALEVETRNMVNAKRNQVTGKLLSYFDTLVGHRILKATGELYKSVETKINEIVDSADCSGYRTYIEAGPRLLWFHIDKTYGWKQGVDYVKACACLAIIDHGVLVDTISASPLREEHRTEDIINAQDQIERLEVRVSELKSTIREFNSFRCC